LSVQSPIYNASYPIRYASNPQSVRSVTLAPVASEKIPEWMPLIAIFGGVSFFAFAGFWLSNQKKKGVQSVSLVVDKAIEKTDTFIDSTVKNLNKTNTASKKLNTVAKTYPAVAENSAYSNNTQTVSLWKRIGLSVTALFAGTIALASTIPTKVATLGNKLYTLEFVCKSVASEGVRLEVTKVPANEGLFKRTTQAIPELLESKADCPTLLPALNDWGKNTPSPFLPALIDDGNKGLGIIDFNTKQLTPFNAKVLPSPQEIGRANVRFIPIAPVVKTNPSTLKRVIPLKVQGTLPEAYQKTLEEAFGYINELPEGRLLLEKVVANQTKLVYVPFAELSDREKTGAIGGWFQPAKNTIFIPETAISVSLAVKNQILSSSELSTTKWITHVLIHEMGHALVSDYIQRKRFNYSEEQAVELLARSLTRQLFGDNSPFPLEAAKLIRFAKPYQSKLSAFDPTNKQASEILTDLGFGDYSVVNTLTKQAEQTN
jgi:hypothetical protein